MAPATGSAHISAAAKARFGAAASICSNRLSVDERWISWAISAKRVQLSLCAPLVRVGIEMQDTSSFRR
jgi:hypothetical protein